MEGTAYFSCRQFALWLKENYSKLSFLKWEYSFLSIRRSNFLSWKVWVRCSLQPWLLLSSSFSCPHLMGRHHSSRKDNVDRKGRSDYENLFCSYCCCNPTACCLKVLPFALWGYLNLAEKIPALSWPPWNPAAVFLHLGLWCLICDLVSKNPSQQGAPVDPRKPASDAQLVILSPCKLNLTSHLARAKHGNAPYV